MLPWTAEPLSELSRSCLGPSAELENTVISVDPNPYAGTVYTHRALVYLLPYCPLLLLWLLTPPSSHQVLAQQRLESSSRMPVQQPTLKLPPLPPLPLLDLVLLLELQRKHRLVLLLHLVPMLDLVPMLRMQELPVKLLVTPQAHLLQPVRLVGSANICIDNDLTQHASAG